MTSETSCPVCGLEHIHLDKAKCPQCDADLTCFKILDSFPDEPVRDVKGPRAWNIAFYAIAMVICLVTAITVFQYYQFKRIESLLMDQQKHLSGCVIGINASVEAAGLKSDQPGAQLSALSTQSTCNATEGRPLGVSERKQEAGILPVVLEKTDFWVYDAVDTDTLWDISERYYGSGRYYPVLFEHNPHLRIYEIGDGIRMKILKDTKLARDIYFKMSMTEGDKTYWNYAASEGDTLRSVAGKFYRMEETAKQISNLKFDVRLQPGQRIWMLLE
ncbi:MAG: LysM peptidoglycan-binding domain-containing protein [Thermodesulfobacteriota bacterium]|nr:LysM peptidoglycan-binding domain-containing protein [Thermodesulfobacteriota bacterium]